MNAYKKFFIQIIIIFLLLIITIFIVSDKFLVGNAIIINKEVQMVDTWLDIKKGISECTKKMTPRLVFIAGSNVTFGIDATTLEKIFNIPVINYGSNAGLGPYIFIDAKRILQPGDIVFLPLENPFFSHEQKINSTNGFMQSYIFGYDKDYYNKQPVIFKIKLINYMLHSIISFQIKNIQISSDSENSYYIDKHAVTTAAIGNIVTQKGVILNSTYKFEGDEYNKDWELSKFLLWCKENDIKVFAMTANLYRESPMKDDEKKEFEKIKKYYSNYDVKFIDEPEGQKFEYNDMFDTEYHLNNVGRAKRSKYLEQVIKQAIPDVIAEAQKQESIVGKYDSCLEKSWCKVIKEKQKHGLKIKHNCSSIATE